MLTQDKIETYKGCIIQHGHYSDRIYLVKTTLLPPPELPYELIELAKTHGYSKIFAKVPENIAKVSFSNAGFLEEARIPAFFLEKETAVFMGFYLNAERIKESNVEKMENILKIAFGKRATDKIQPLAGRFILRKCNKTDVSVMAKIYREVFPSYPFPIHDPNYLLKTMQSHIDYFGIEVDGRLVAVSSAEIDKETFVVEMTDFATLPDWRGSKFAQHLLLRMENEMKKKDIKIAYTIARAMSPGMNVTFSKAGYQFRGRLKNNTNISGRIESMNVWHKALD